MSTELLKLYKQLDDMPQTPEVVQIRNRIKETLYHRLRQSLLELTGIGRVIGYGDLQEELAKAMELVEMQRRGEGEP